MEIYFIIIPETKLFLNLLLVFWTECLCPWKIHMLISNSKCDSIWRWGLWEVISSWCSMGGALINEISALIRRDQTHFFPCIAIRRFSSLQPRRELVPEPNQADTIFLDFQPPELWEMNFLLLISPLVYNILLQQSKLAKTLVKNCSFLFYPNKIKLHSSSLF